MSVTRSLWSYAETVLALELATSVGRSAAASDSRVVDLSNLLRMANDTDDARYRNAHGVACKVGRLGALIDGETLPGGARLEREIWDEYVGRPEALAAAARAAETSLSIPSVTSFSRGPVPAFGDIATTRRDGVNYVYLAWLAGAALPDGRLLAKIGRSADVPRRMEELNGGLPAPLGMRWQAVATWPHRDAASAHTAEQAILARCDVSGLCVGGEFIAVDAEVLEAVAGTRGRVSGRSVLSRSPSGRGRRGLREGRRHDRARHQG